MSSYQKINSFLTSPLLASTFFLVSGVHKTYKDYKNADDKYKERFLIKDTVVLAGAAAGMFFASNSGRYLQKLKPVQNFVEKQAKKIVSKIPKNQKMKKNLEVPLSYGKEIVQNTMSNLFLFASGLTGALLADYGLGKLGFKQPKMKQKDKKREKGVLEKTLEKAVGKDVKNAMITSITDMPQLQSLTSGIIGTKALDLSKEKEMDKKLEAATSCLINNSLVPMLLLSIATISTQKLKSSYRMLSIFAILIAGTIASNKIQKHILEK